MGEGTVPTDRLAILWIEAVGGCGGYELWVVVFGLGIERGSRSPDGARLNLGGERLVAEELDRVPIFVAFTHGEVIHAVT